MSESCGFSSAGLPNAWLSSISRILKQAKENMGCQEKSSTTERSDNGYNCSVGGNILIDNRQSLER